MPNSQDISFLGELRLRGIYLEDDSVQLEIRNSEEGIFTLGLNSDFDSSQIQRIHLSELVGFSEGLFWYNYGPVFSWMVPAKLDLKSIQYQDRIRFLFFQYADLTYGAIFPITRAGYSVEIKIINHRIVIEVDSDADLCKSDFLPIVSIAFGIDPYETIRKSLSEVQERDKVKGESILLPHFFNQLGWCSWNAFGHEVSGDLLIDAAQTFDLQSIKPKWFLIDDGWMNVSGNYGTGKLVSFEPRSDKFPYGLKYYINELKGKFEIDKVGIWLTISGYWNGIQPDSELFEKYNDELISISYQLPWGNCEVHEVWIPAGSKDGKNQFFYDWFSNLKSEGIDFVKIDHLNILSEISKISPNGHQMAFVFFQGVKREVDAIFGENHAIYCMGMVPEVYNFLNKDIIVRVSEDYFPHNQTYKPLAGNAAVHALNNFSVSSWMQYLVKPDGDIFQTYHPNASLHAAVRFLMGSPIYITDLPNSLSLAFWDSCSFLLEKSIKVDKPAVPISSCLFQLYEHKPYIVQTSYGCDYLVGIFNLADADFVEGAWCLEDLGLKNGENYEIISLNKGLSKLVKSNHKNLIHLKRMDWEIFRIKVV